MDHLTALPVTLVTGFLGAGKTTLINHLVGTAHGRKLGIIVNEFDPLGIDRDLIVATDGPLVEMTNGCLCCSVGGDLKAAVADLLAAGARLDGLVIETTGLANPGPIATAFFADPFLCDATRLDAIVTLVDAAHLRRTLADDVLGAAGGPDQGVAHAQIAYADVLLLNKTDLVDAATLAELAAELRAINPLARLTRCIQSQVPIDQLLGLGAFELDERFSSPETPEHAHDHDPAIRSCSFRYARPFDPIKLNTFFCDLLRTYPETLYRCKGIVAVADEAESLVFQGVSALFATSPGRRWPDLAARESRLVFIGKALDSVWIRRELEACLV